MISFAVALGLLFWLKALPWRTLFASPAAIRTIERIDPMMIGFVANNMFPVRAGNSFGST